MRAYMTLGGKQGNYWFDCLLNQEATKYFKENIGSYIANGATSELVIRDMTRTCLDMMNYYVFTGVHSALFFISKKQVNFNQIIYDDLPDWKTVKLLEYGGSLLPLLSIPVNFMNLGGVVAPVITGQVVKGYVIHGQMFHSLGEAKKYLHHVKDHISPQEYQYEKSKLFAAMYGAGPKKLGLMGNPK